MHSLTLCAPGGDAAEWLNSGTCTEEMAIQPIGSFLACSFQEEEEEEEGEG